MIMLNRNIYIYTMEKPKVDIKSIKKDREKQLQSNEIIKK